MKYFNSIILLIISFSLFSGLASAYQWPFENVNSAHPIRGTLGEYRSGHFHHGVDILPSGGAKTGADATPIKAIEGCDKAIIGKDGTDTEFVECGKFKYIHIDVKVKARQKVEAGDTIAV